MNSEREDPLVRKVRDYVTGEGLLRRRDRVVVAVSGGADSLALLHILWTLRAEFVLDLLVASLDHGFRGEAGRSDVAFVGETARGLGLPFREGRSGEDRPGGASVEETARRLRYAFLGQVAGEWGPGPAGPARVATGHTADDQAETILMRLIEGTGLEGLAGMPSLREDHGWVLVRPLLRTTRTETMAYCDRLGLVPRVDETNRDERFRRNFVRARVMPTLRDYNPRVVEALARLGDLAREETAALEAALDAALAAAAATVFGAGGQGAGPVVPSESPFGGLALADRPYVVLDREVFRLLPETLQRRLVRRVLGGLAGEEVLRDVGLEGAARAARAVTGLRVGGRLHLPGQIVLEAGYAEVFFAVVASRGGRPARAQAKVELRIPGPTVAAEIGWTFTVDRLGEGGGQATRPGEGPTESAFTLELDPLAVTFPLFVRTRRCGDSFRPAGLGGSKKLKDLFIGQKLPRAERDRWPLLVDADDRIVWVVGFRADERVLAQRSAEPETEREVLRVTAKSTGCPRPPGPA